MDKTKQIWNWMLQIAYSYALATIFLVVLSLILNLNANIIIFENIQIIRWIEILGGIYSFIVISIQFFIRWHKMGYKLDG